MKHNISIGLTEMHGIAQEYSQFPPKDTIYSEIYPSNHLLSNCITSSAKGVLNYFDGNGVDLIEAPLFPILTRKPWIYTPADYPTAANFGLFNLPLPRSLRLYFLKKIFLQDNFKKLIFKSDYGRQTLLSYGGQVPPELLEKVMVVYPAIRMAPVKKKIHRSHLHLTFVGDLIMKGGTHVIDAFEELQRSFPNIKLRLCSSESLNTTNKELAVEYLNKIKNNQNIELGLVSRSELINQILPNTDIFLSPTYRESYGYSIQEATAHGIPVISSNIGAIPEIVNHSESGFLVDIEHFPFIQNLKTYNISQIPSKFAGHVTSQVLRYLKLLVENPEKRREMGANAQKIAREKFSFEKRNAVMHHVYTKALSS